MLPGRPSHGRYSSARRNAATSRKPADAHHLHLGERAQLARDGPDLLGAPPRRRVVSFRARRARPHDEQRHDDDDREHRRHDDVAAEVEVERTDAEGVVPADVDLEQPERDRGSGDGRQVGEPAEHQRRRARSSSTVRPTGEPSGIPVMPARRNERDEREHGGDDPHAGVQSPDGDAQQRGAVGAIGGHARGDADVGEAEEQRDGDHRERGEDPRGRVVGVEDERLDFEPPGDRDGDAAGERSFAPQLRERERAEREQLREADRRDGEDQPRRAEEPSDDRELDDRADDDRAGESDEEGEEVVEAGEEDEVDGERDREEAEVALREVEDAVGAVDEGHAEGDEHAEHAEGDALDDEAPGVGAAVEFLAGEEDLLRDDDRDGRSERACEPTPARRQVHGRRLSAP